MPDLSALIQRWQGGDERAAEAIYNYHREATFRLAYGLLGNTADAEEAAQDALTYALSHIRQGENNVKEGYDQGVFGRGCNSPSTNKSTFSL
jgi:DNA-directed RNA polymerase specialized sigma24 family protein